MTTSDAELLRFCDYVLKYYNPEGDAEALTIARALKEKLTPAPEPVPPLDEIAEIAIRHENTHHNFPEITTVDHRSPNALLQIAHRDRATLLRLLRSRTFGVDKEALAKWFSGYFHGTPDAVDSDYELAQALIDSGLIGKAG